MATAADIAELRNDIQELDDVDPYTDEFLGSMIDKYTLRGAASKLWESKAASVAHLMDISEGGSSRKMSQLYDRYMALSDRYADNAPSPMGISAPTTRKIDRA